MSKKAKSAKKKFVFRRHATIGATDAIEDKVFLEQSFIDRGELDILTNKARPECIILGRTGTGKTALLKMLKRNEERVIQIAPESLALSYISNNGVLRFFMSAGVDMDLFYRLLWRHVFATEIIKAHYHIINRKTRDNFLVQLKDRISNNKSKQDAIDYLIKWGEQFWQDTEYRVKEITNTMEKDLSASISGGIDGIIPPLAKGKVNLTAEVAQNLTTEQKSEVFKRGQEAVDKVQIRTLNEVIRLLESDILDDRQKKYYITIDRLDENWVNDELRYHLIRALLETIREFNNKLSNVKIIVAVREDLLDRVFRRTRSAGYQEEKYKSLYLELIWNEDEIGELLQKRVNQLVREQYTKAAVPVRELLPGRVKKENPLHYILRRTLYRPRDVIMFFNECIKAGENKAKLNQDAILKAESIYSLSRLRAIGDEWIVDYPNLLDVVFFLRNFPSSFQPENYKNKFEDEMLDYLIVNQNATSEMKNKIYYIVEENFTNNDTDAFIIAYLKILYRVGVIGIRSKDTSSPIKWSFSGYKPMSSEIRLDTQVSIHPAFWNALDVS